MGYVSFDYFTSDVIDCLLLRYSMYGSDNFCHIIPCRLMMSAKDLPGRQVDTQGEPEDDMDVNTSYDIRPCTGPGVETTMSTRGPGE